MISFVNFDSDIQVFLDFSNLKISRKFSQFSHVNSFKNKLKNLVKKIFEKKVRKKKLISVQSSEFSIFKIQTEFRKAPLENFCQGLRLFCGIFLFFHPYEGFS